MKMEDFAEKFQKRFFSKKVYFDEKHAEKIQF